MAKYKMMRWPWLRKILKFMLDAAAIIAFFSLSLASSSFDYSFLLHQRKIYASLEKVRKIKGTHKTMHPSPMIVQQK